MNSERRVEAAVRDSRLRLADYLDDLPRSLWSQPSLCEGWTVTDVVAHLSLSTTVTWRGMIVGVIRHFGDWDRWNAAAARRQATAHRPDELVEIIRRSADSRRHSPGSSAPDQLVDLLVHGQDIARAIGSPLTDPIEPATIALEHALASRWYGAKKRLSDVRLEASDTDWSTGNGATIRGPVGSLLLVATGRATGLDDLEGSGVPIVRRRLG